MATERSPLRDAYAQCCQITRSEAGNFFYGIRLLPAAKRDAMCAVYAFARRVDDIGDGTMAEGRKRAELDAVADAIAHLGNTVDGGRVGAGSNGSQAADPVMQALADASERFQLPTDALAELVEGVRMDVDGTHYEEFEQLVLYCRRVAGGIGRLCLAIFGVRDARAAAWAPVAADELGVALQLTNILRDVREDAGRGRVYLPREDLDRFGLLADHGDARSNGQAGALLALRGPSPAFDALIQFEVVRAREWYGRGISLLEQLDWRSSACVLAMVGIYRRLLDRIAAHPAATLQGRLSLPPYEKAWVATQGLFGVAG